jgi:hypothetical protein
MEFLCEEKLRQAAVKHYGGQMAGKPMASFVF